MGGVVGVVVSLGDGAPGARDSRALIGSVSCSACLSPFNKCNMHTSNMYDMYNMYTLVIDILMDERFSDCLEVIEGQQLLGIKCLGRTVAAQLFVWVEGSANSQTCAAPMWW